MPQQTVEHCIDPSEGSSNSDKSESISSLAATTRRAALRCSNRSWLSAGRDWWRPPVARTIMKRRSTGWRSA